MGQRWKKANLEKAELSKDDYKILSKICKKIKLNFN